MTSFGKLTKKMTEAYIAETCKNLVNLNYVVYVLRSQANSDLMYCGMTNNLKRRLRQHNGHLKGGGEYTAENRPWHLAAIIPIPGEPNADTKSVALHVEYWTKAKNYPAVRKFEEAYICPAQNEIPTADPVVRRVWLLRETLRRHRLPTVIWLDPAFIAAYNAL